MFFFPHLHIIYLLTWYNHLFWHLVFDVALLSLCVPVCMLIGIATTTDKHAAIDVVTHSVAYFQCVVCMIEHTHTHIHAHMHQINKQAQKNEQLFLIWPKLLRRPDMLKEWAHYRVVCIKSCLPLTNSNEIYRSAAERILSISVIPIVSSELDLSLFLRSSNQNPSSKLSFFSKFFINKFYWWI